MIFFSGKFCLRSESGVDDLDLVPKMPLTFWTIKVIYMKV